MTYSLEKKINLATVEYEEAADEIGRFIIKEVTECRYSGGVIGLSGGVDSTLTAILAKKAFDKYNADLPEENKNKSLELIGYILPSRINSRTDAIDGKRVAENLGIRYQEVSIEPIVEAYKITNPEAFEKAYDSGNLMSRIRGNLLATKAATERKLIIGTGNRDEDFGVGYYTLFGDGAVHMSPIGNLPKRIVRGMARYFGYDDIADKISTAGLEPGQSDFKDLGYSYDLVELVSEGILQGISKEEMYSHSQIISQGQNDLDKYRNDFGNSRFKDVPEMITDVLSRMYVAKKKAEIISPPRAKVTLKYE